MACPALEPPSPFTDFGFVVLTIVDMGLYYVIQMFHADLNSDI